ncbi:unnamed protein product [Closterium sp. Naga37s-1]|nr:unnamed protein product [Closterium sp. Naga37s-1]
MPSQRLAPSLPPVTEVDEEARSGDISDASARCVDASSRGVDASTSKASGGGGKGERVEVQGESGAAANQMCRDDSITSTPRSETSECRTVYTPNELLQLCDAWAAPWEDRRPGSQSASPAPRASSSSSQPLDLQRALSCDRASLSSISPSTPSPARTASGSGRISASPGRGSGGFPPQPNASPGLLPPHSPMVLREWEEFLFVKNASPSPNASFRRSRLGPGTGEGSGESAKGGGECVSGLQLDPGSAINGGIGGDDPNTDPALRNIRLPIHKMRLVNGASRKSGLIDGSAADRSGENARASSEGFVNMAEGMMAGGNAGKLFQLLEQVDKHGDYFRGDVEDPDLTSSMDLDEEATDDEPGFLARTDVARLVTDGTDTQYLPRLNKYFPFGAFTIFIMMQALVAVVDSPTDKRAMTATSLAICFAVSSLCPFIKRTGHTALVPRNSWKWPLAVRVGSTNLFIHADAQTLAHAVTKAIAFVPLGICNDTAASILFPGTHPSPLPSSLTTSHDAQTLAHAVTKAIAFVPLGICNDMAASILFPGLQPYWLLLLQLSTFHLLFSTSLPTSSFLRPLPSRFLPPTRSTTLLAAPAAALHVPPRGFALITQLPLFLLSPPTPPPSHSPPPTLPSPGLQPYWLLLLQLSTFLLVASLTFFVHDHVPSIRTAARPLEPSFFTDEAEEHAHPHHHHCTACMAAAGAAACETSQISFPLPCPSPPPPLSLPPSSFTDEAEEHAHPHHHHCTACMAAAGAAACETFTDEAEEHAHPHHHHCTACMAAAGAAACAPASTHSSKQPSSPVPHSPTKNPPSPHTTLHPSQTSPTSPECNVPSSSSPPTHSPSAHSSPPSLPPSSSATPLQNTSFAGHTPPPNRFSAGSTPLLLRGVYTPPHDSPPHSLTPACSTPPAQNTAFAGHTPPPPHGFNTACSTPLLLKGILSPRSAADSPFSAAARASSSPPAPAAASRSAASVVVSVPGDRSYTEAGAASDAADADAAAGGSEDGGMGDGGEASTGDSGVLVASGTSGLAHCLPLSLNAY